MILHLGGDAVVPTENIIAIIDMETAAQSGVNKDFIQTAEEEGFVQYISEDPPKSCILAEVNKKTVLFMSPISSVTLLKRSGFIDDITMDRTEDEEDTK